MKLNVSLYQRFFLCFTVVCIFGLDSNVYDLLALPLALFRVVVQMPAPRPSSLVLFASQ